MHSSSAVMLSEAQRSRSISRSIRCAGNGDPSTPACSLRFLHAFRGIGAGSWRARTRRTSEQGTAELPSSSSDLRHLEFLVRYSAVQWGCGR
jgi:hypothetical protein